MAERDQQVYPAPPSDHHRNSLTKPDEESGTTLSTELRRKKRTKCLAYVAAFAVFQTAVILVFALVVMKVRTPKFEVRAATVETFDAQTNTTPSFDIRMYTAIRVKNTNFGPYKYQNSTVVFYYRGTPVGEASFPKGKAGFRSSKRFGLVVSLSSNNLGSDDISPQLRSDLDSGVITLNSRSRVEGKAEMMWFLFKKKKATEMDCTLTIGVDRTMRNIVCQ